MSRKLFITKDGSASIEETKGVTFHSIHGAIQESQHIYIREGLRRALGQPGNPAGTSSDPAGYQPLAVFEMGLGTGLNALLTLIEAEKVRVPVFYESVDAYPLEEAFVRQLNYCKILERPDLEEGFLAMHAPGAEVPLSVNPWFSFSRSCAKMEEYSMQRPASLVYYDAFDPVAQPELWAPAIFENLYRQMAREAILVTYSAKGSVRRALVGAGFRVEKLAGPPGKREMTRAIKGSYSNV
jgi:tRNA U34 5-methylaminomethyl-2-thiouridine-forming methyltransferase MnmC